MKTTFFHTISIISHNISLCVKTASLTSDIVQNGFSLLPSSKKNFTDYLKKPISKNFITAPTTSDLQGVVSKYLLTSTGHTYY